MTYIAEVKNKRKKLIKVSGKFIIRCMACGGQTEQGSLCNKCRFYK